jgi:penicillin-binding protein 1C
VSPLSAYWTTDILADAQAREYIFGRGGSLEFPFPVAVKTGTSQAYHDNWTIGYTREVTVGVWVGNFDRSPLRHSTGVTGAGPIFHAVMLAAVARLKSRFAPQEAVGIVPRPEGLRERSICALSGMLANEWCPTREREWLPVRDEPPCSWHHHSDEGPLLIWPAEYRVWAKQQGLLQDQAPRLPVGTNASSGPDDHGARRPIAIANPPAGATYLIDPTLRREFQTLALRAVTQTRADVEWRINERVVGSSSSDSPVLWPLVPGSHRIVARDGRGNSAEATILVR